MGSKSRLFERYRNKTGSRSNFNRCWSSINKKGRITGIANSHFVPSDWEETYQRIRDKLSYSSAHYAGWMTYFPTALEDILGFGSCAALLDMYHPNYISTASQLRDALRHNKPMVFAVLTPLGNLASRMPLMVYDYQMDKWFIIDEKFAQILHKTDDITVCNRPEMYAVLTAGMMGIPVMRSSPMYTREMEQDHLYNVNMRLKERVRKTLGFE